MQTVRMTHSNKRWLDEGMNVNNLKSMKWVQFGIKLLKIQISKIYNPLI